MYVYYLVGIMQSGIFEKDLTHRLYFCSSKEFKIKGVKEFK